MDWCLLCSVLLHILCKLMEYQAKIQILMHRFGCWVPATSKVRSPNPRVSSCSCIGGPNHGSRCKQNLFPMSELIPHRYRNAFLLFSAHLSKKKCCIVRSQQHPRIPSKWLHREPQLPAGASGLLLKGHLCFTGNRIIKLSARENLRRFFFLFFPPASKSKL